MAKKSTRKSVKDQMIEAALNLAAEKSWSDVTLADIAWKADLSPVDVREYFDEKSCVLAAYGRLLDRKIIEADLVSDEALSEREKLFDLLMERFDILNENRESVISILSSMKGDPKQAILGLPHLGNSMGRMLEAAGIDTGGVCGAVKVSGLVGVYLWTLRTWKDDDSPDMGKTMAALDKSLDRAEQVANSFMEDGLFSLLKSKTSSHD